LLGTGRAERFVEVDFLPATEDKLVDRRRTGASVPDDWARCAGSTGLFAPAEEERGRVVVGRMGDRGKSVLEPALDGEAICSSISEHQNKIIQIKKKQYYIFDFLYAATRRKKHNK
jgi:hypothetical protein